jgi:hypothetical protein
VCVWWKSGGSGLPFGERWMALYLDWEQPHMLPVSHTYGWSHPTAHPTSIIQPPPQHLTVIILSFSAVSFYRQSSWPKK